MTTVLQQLDAAARATRERRRHGRPMTFGAGQVMMRHGTDLVHLAVVVDDVLCGRAEVEALAEAFAPFRANIEAEQGATGT